MSQDYLSYTALWNICAIPEFLAALSDKDADVRAPLRYRSFDLYGVFPPDAVQPEKPPSYAELRWRQPHPVAVKNLERYSAPACELAARAAPQFQRKIRMAVH